MFEFRLGRIGVWMMAVGLGALFGWGCMDPPDVSDDDDTLSDDDDTTADDDSADDDSVDDDSADDDSADDDTADDDDDTSVPVDADGDGYDDSVDCDDSDPAVHPGATEVCDGVDTDCYDGPEADEVDADGDGWMVCELDCDDAEPLVNPGLAEVPCDGLDNDCDAATLDLTDDDGDGFTTCDGDCDDTDLTMFPGAPEICDYQDNDCFGTVDELCTTCDVVVPADAATIQDGINIAGGMGYSMVCVEPGTYAENLTFNGYATTVLGLAGSAYTVIDGGGQGSVVTFDNGEGAGSVLDGFTVTNGYASQHDGGGIYTDSTSPTLRNLLVTGNETTNSGGGLGARNSNAAPTVINTTFAGNVANHGGGVAITYSCTPSFLNVRLVDNVAASKGGGLSVYTGCAALENAILTGNEATGADGGGAYLWNTTSELYLTNVVVTGNATGSNGGGLYQYQHSEMWVTNSILTDNAAGNDGGGIYLGFGNYGNWYPTYNDAYGNTPNNYAGEPNPTGTDGNVSLPPGFVDVTAPDSQDWDLRLDDGYYNSTSYLIDLGDGALLDPDGSTSDLGAYGGPLASEWDVDHDGYYEWYLGSAPPGDPYDCDDHDAALNHDDEDEDGFSTCAGDCDDLDPAVYPGNGC